MNPSRILRLCFAALALATSAFAATPPAFTSHPPAKNSTGGAVLIVPGTGATADALPLARWLNDRGLAAFVLPPTATAAETASALRHVRAHAADLKISPQRIALLGFASGAATAATLAYDPSSAADSARPDLLALIWGAPATLPAAGDGVKFPPTFLVGSTATGDHPSPTINLWTKLRAARSPVDAHFFARADLTSVLASGNPSAAAWPELFFNWARFSGLLTAEPRVPLKGMAYLDGRPLPHGYIIFTPLDAAGVGPVIGRVINSTAGVAIGEFSVPAGQGPLAGRYKVDVRQNMHRWLSNSFSGALVQTRGAAPTPEQAHFGHHRVLSPSIADQLSFTKVRPTDAQDYVIEFKPDPAANLDLKIAVFSTAQPAAAAPANSAAAPAHSGAESSAPAGGIVGGPKNPGQAAYAEQLKLAPPGPVPGIPEPILLWPEGAPGALADANGVFTDEDKPALYAFPAPAANNTGAAFLIIPGGGFTNRCMDNEGVQVARFLNRHGISGFVLRYRIGPNYSSRDHSTQDGQRAQRYLRAHAAHFGVAPDRIGVIGFSAGGSLIADAFYNQISLGDPAAADPLERISARANFSAMIYGGRTFTKPAAAPPTFLFSTVEDTGGLGSVVSALTALRGANIPTEAHVNQVGPHGTALSPGDPQLGAWPELLVKWLRTGGFLDAKSARPAAR